ncbi:MAG: hypothetical protein KF823_05805 [Xanthomonadales bacterium]|nr:hypothetical protein [Xanthomonadales bacterium]
MHVFRHLLAALAVLTAPAVAQDEAVPEAGDPGAGLEAADPAPSFDGVPDAVAALLAAEAAFGDEVATRGVRDGFLRHLAEEAIVFRPLPTPARAWFAAQAEPDFLLQWTPWFVELAGAGDFGYTLGQWASTALDPEARAAGYGHYLTVWIRLPDGTWKVLADHGIGGLAQSSGEPASVQVRGEDRSMAAEGSWLMNTRWVALHEASLRLAGSQAQQQPVPSSWLAQDLIVLRPGRGPVSGHEATRLVVTDRHGGTEPMTTLMAASGDLGLSLGGEAGVGAWLRIWRHLDDRGWILAVDVATPVPPAAP